MALLNFSSLYILDVANALRIGKSTKVHAASDLNLILFKKNLLVNSNHGRKQPIGVRHEICENEFKTCTITLGQNIKCFSNASQFRVDRFRGNIEDSIIPNCCIKKKGKKSVIYRVSKIKIFEFKLLLLRNCALETISW